MANISMVDETIRYIEEHIFEKLDLIKLAEALHYSKYHIHRSFHEVCGMTVYTYIQRRKLSEAARLLVFSHMRILDISLLAGYTSQQAFSTIFKAMYIKTPSKFRREEEYYPLQLPYSLQKTVYYEDDWFHNICYATLSDIPQWMDLVHLIVDGFPHLHEETYAASLPHMISNYHALIIKQEIGIIACMLFDAIHGEILFFGIHPQYRKQGIANAFIKKIMTSLYPGNAISITSFRHGDKADLGYRSMLTKLGFEAGETLHEFSYPTQRFWYYRKEDV